MITVETTWGGWLGQHVSVASATVAPTAARQAPSNRGPMSPAVRRSSSSSAPSSSPAKGHMVEACLSCGGFRLCHHRDGSPAGRDAGERRLPTGGSKRRQRLIGAAAHRFPIQKGSGRAAPVTQMRNHHWVARRSMGSGSRPETVKQAKWSSSWPRPRASRRRCRGAGPSPETEADVG